MDSDHSVGSARNVSITTHPEARPRNKSPVQTVDIYRTLGPQPARALAEARSAITAQVSIPAFGGVPRHYMDNGRVLLQWIVSEGHCTSITNVDQVGERSNVIQGVCQDIIWITEGCCCSGLCQKATVLPSQM